MFNFKNGKYLAIQQDQYLKKYLSGEKLSLKEMSDIEQNLWVAVASKLAPSNLIIRQYALIDLFKNEPKHKKQILRLLETLTYRKKNKYKLSSHPEGCDDLTCKRNYFKHELYAEGYSYFCYTMDILKLWIGKFEFKSGEISKNVDQIYQGFFATSYYRNNILYPAPFGDLRDSSLNSDFQLPHKLKSAVSAILNFNVDCSDNVWYLIRGKPIGFNTHIPKNDYFVRIVDGIPLNFKFYEGYEKKYKNKFEEFRDTFSFKRLISLLS
jgi:hypothetical protein